MCSDNHVLNRCLLKKVKESRIAYGKKSSVHKKKTRISLETRPTETINPFLPWEPPKTLIWFP